MNRENQYPVGMCSSQLTPKETFGIITKNSFEDQLVNWRSGDALQPVDSFALYQTKLHLFLLVIILCNTLHTPSDTKGNMAFEILLGVTITGEWIAQPNIKILLHVTSR